MFVLHVLTDQRTLTANLTLIPEGETALWWWWWYTLRCYHLEHATAAPQYSKAPRNEQDNSTAAASTALTRQTRPTYQPQSCRCGL